MIYNILYGTTELDDLFINPNYFTFSLNIVDLKKKVLTEVQTFITLKKIIL